MSKPQLIEPEVTDDGPNEWHQEQVLEVTTPGSFPVMARELNNALVAASVRYDRAADELAANILALATLTEQASDQVRDLLREQKELIKTHLPGGKK
jgi:hypothetical protein